MIVGSSDGRLARRVTRHRFLREGMLVGLTIGAGALAACSPEPAPLPTTAPAAKAPAAAPAATSQAVAAPTVAAQPTAVPAAALPAVAPTAAPTTAAVAAGQPRRGGTLNAAAEVDPVSLVPTSSNFSGLEAYDPVYESLAAYDEKMNIIPALAEKWEISEDGMTYTFHLRPNVTFHNGQPLTADDVKYSFEYYLDPKGSNPWRSWLGPMKEVKVVDPATVQTIMGSPFPPLLGGLAGNRGTAIMPKGFADTENVKLKAVGTGPFKLVEYVPLDHISYTRNASYWNQPLPYLDGMVFKILQEESTRLAALESGQIDYAWLSAQGAAQIADAKGINVLKAPYAWVDSTSVNVSSPDLTDARVRRALRMSIDTKDSIQKAVLGAAVPSGPVPAGYGDWPIAPDQLPYLTADLDGAKKLLSDAGHAGGAGINVIIKCSPQYPDFVANATIMKDSFAKIGVQSSIVQEEWGTFVKDSSAFKYQMGNTAYTFRPDPDGYLYPYFHTKGVNNAGNYSNPKLDTMLDQARTISDHAQRVTLYHQIQEIVLTDCPNFWWYTKYNIEAVSNKLHGYTQSFTGRRMFLRKAWLEG
ncbi:MAG: ABC transporter substrate-binding protein [Chloroflexota bacterium]